MWRPQPPQNPGPPWGLRTVIGFVPAYVNFLFHCIQQTISDALQVGTGSRLAPKVQVSVFGVENEGRTLRRPVRDGWMDGGMRLWLCLRDYGPSAWGEGGRADRGSTS